MKSWTKILLHLMLIPTAATHADDDTFFETEVRPVLAEHCFECHGPKKQKANLRLDSLESMRTGGDSGAAVKPGFPSESLLIDAIHYENYQMPPGGKLPAGKIAALVAWVKMGAPWPGAGGEPVAPVRKNEEITEEDRAYWAFQPIRRSDRQELKSSSQPEHAIDHFVLARLEEHGILPNRPATARELVRRSFFDLIGLPPTPSEMTTWLRRLTSADTSQDSSQYEALLDDLLSRPQYGERWGRHWLDVVRFAQTNGYERDGEKPLAWRYRDYVIDSFNADKPYDRFLIEQLAGDELPNPTAESRIATAYFRLGVHDDEPDDPRQAEFDGLDDIMVTTGAAFMGLTLGCARCHSHKFDPIRHADYYSTLAFFRNVRHYETPNDTPESATLLPISDDSEVRAAIEARNKRVTEIEAKLKATSDEDERKKLENEKGDRRLQNIEWTLAVREHGRDAVKTNVLIRGNAGTPGEEVGPMFPAVLGGGTPEIAAPENDLFPTSGRRLAFARWLASPEHPLTARVIANRVWHYHFGRGIVATTSNFGKAGQQPTHPELLDWLAAELIDNGWSLKRLHKTIMLSDTYRRSSRAAPRSSGVELDPGNQWLWRQNMRRLEAEAIRDTVLAVSGQLNTQPGGRGFFPNLGGEVLAGGSRPGDGWEVSPPDQQRRRSVYTFIKRTLASPMLDSFDYANTTQPMTERSTTTIAPQALMLLNDRFMQQQSVALANRIAAEVGSEVRGQVGRAFQLALQRDSTEREIELATNFYARRSKQLHTMRPKFVFYPDVPASLHEGYLDRLKPEDVLIGPREGWTYSRGRWTDAYEKIKSVDPVRGPFALWDGMLSSVTTVQGNIKISRASKLASLLVRAKVEGESYRGYEVLLLPRENRILLNRHRGEVVQLAEASFAIPTETFLPIQIEAVDDHLRVWLGHEDEPVIVVRDEQPFTEPGNVGVRTWGGELTVEDLTVNNGTEEAKIGTDQSRGDNEQQALESLCLLILNLNEMIYVD